jgi:tRNA dimethylallyltransferase
MAPLIVITGPTASGKTGMAIKLAKKYGGEIVCADSRTIYRGMDIGTAKPSPEVQSAVSHHMIDIAEPGERYTVIDFQGDAMASIKDIRDRGKIPFLVGGTGLYVDAVTLEFEWPEIDERQGLDDLSVESLQLMIKEQQLTLPKNLKNKRHLISILKRGNNRGNGLAQPREMTYVVAISTEKYMLKKQIEKRAISMFEMGVVEETVRLGKRYGWDSEAMKSNIYPIVRRFIEGEITKEEARELVITRDVQLAKRQITWLKRHAYVRWLSLEDTEHYIETVLG